MSTRECRMTTMAPHLRCQSCRKWQEHCYQEHLVRERVSFFKLMTGDFTRGISIPEEFVSNLNGQITKLYNLKSPSGETWLVNVTKNADELLFKSGWDDFARAHKLQENDLVIFTCNGNCSFDVLILDSSGCEKVSCFFTTKKGPCMHNKHFNGRVYQQAEHPMFSDSEDLGMPLRLLASPHRASTSKQKGGKTDTRKEPEPPSDSNYHIKQEAMSDEEQSDEEWLADCSYYYSKSAKLTGGERDQIFSLVSIQPGNPVFVAVLLKSHLGHTNNMLIIHHGFAAEHLEGRSHEILLLRPNRKEKWYVRYYHASNTRGFRCCRWVKFVRDNRLCKDYICVFELMKSAKRTTMVVHVLRKVGNGRIVLVT